MRRALLLLAVLVALVGCGSAPATITPAATTPAASPPGVVESAVTGSGVVADPVTVTIPAISASSSLVGLGLNPDGTAAVPPVTEPAQASWFEPGVRPGEVGPAVILGHRSGRPAGADSSVPGVFTRLPEMAAGDDIEVQRGDGTTAVFAVTSIETYDKDAFDTAAVWGDQNTAQLRLVTCGGVFDAAAGSYTDNVVVFAELVETR